jgi:hypothetical protein
MPRSLKLEVPCRLCSKLFLVKRSEANRGGGKYCSIECYRAGGPRSLWRHFVERTGEPDENGCIHWKGTLSRGYGIIQCTHKDAPSKITYAHRFAFEVANGPIPEGMSVLHMCDEFYPRGDYTYRACVNPLHLFMGTTADNMADMVAKNRQKRGEQCNLSVLNDDIVREIRRRAADGEVKNRLAREFGVSPGNIYAIVNRRSWTHVD